MRPRPHPQQPQLPRPRLSASGWSTGPGGRRASAAEVPGGRASRPVEESFFRLNWGRRPTGHTPKNCFGCRLLWNSFGAESTAFPKFPVSCSRIVRLLDIIFINMVRGSRRFPQGSASKWGRLPGSKSRQNHSRRDINYEVAQGTSLDLSSHVLKAKSKL